MVEADNGVFSEEHFGVFRLKYSRLKRIDTL